MEIEGQVGHLSPEEQRATGYSAEVLLAHLHIAELLDDVMVRIANLERMQAADDDELTHTDRASIGPEIMWQLRRKQIITTIAGQLVAHDCEEYVRGC